MSQNELLRKKIYETLDTIDDPELHVSILKLGLIYDVMIDQTKVTVKMTLTTIGCPLFEVIDQEIKEKIGAHDGVTDVLVDLTFDPPWSVEMIDPETQIVLGLD